MQKFAVIAASLAVLLGLSTAAWFAFRFEADDPFAECRTSVIAGGPAAIAGDFTLVSETGATVTRDEVVDRPALVYFGCTYCPDVCPADAARNADAVDQLAARGIA
ncbi:MAG TPA: SCO family protein, partial [Paracoccaceae bacterium]|nr:SCO family protein [Paracoccaceae bacterium]